MSKKHTFFLAVGRVRVEVALTDYQLRLLDDVLGAEKKGFGPLFVKGRNETAAVAALLAAGLVTKADKPAKWAGCYVASTSIGRDLNGITGAK